MSFCSRGQSELLRRVARHVKTHGRPIARGQDRRMTAPISRISLDYICQMEAVTRYVKRHPGRYMHVPGYADHLRKRDIVYSFGQVERIRSEGWEAVLGSNHVHVFGDLHKMTKDLTMLLLSDDLDAPA